MKTNMKDLSKVFSRALSYIDEGVQCANWSDSFARSETKSVMNRLRKQFTPFYPNEYSRDELEFLGFSDWEGRLMLVPLWLFPCLPKGLYLTSIDGEEKAVGIDEIDNDTRFGLMAWGIKLP